MPTSSGPFHVAPHVSARLQCLAYAPWVASPGQRLARRLECASHLGAQSESDDPSYTATHISLTPRRRRAQETEAGTTDAAQLFLEAYTSSRWPFT